MKSEDQRLEKDPDRRVQAAIGLVFDKFLEIGTVRQTLLWFLEHGLQLPVRDSGGELTWKRPTYGMVYRMLTHPAYGKTESTTRYDSDQPLQSTRRKPRAQWLALIPHAHEGYIDWERFEGIQRMISQNLPGGEQPGAAKRGAALLGGLRRCRRCGRKLVVRYTGRDHDVLRYACDRGWLDNAEPRCIALGGLSVDKAIGQEILGVVQPAAVEAAVLASQEHAHQRDEVLETLKRDLEAARYAAHRAFKQYDAVDPDNRLVVDELERRWNQALQRVQELETRLEQQANYGHPVSAPKREDFEALAADLEAVWNNPDADVRLKKRIVRTLIEEIIVDVDAQASEIVLIVRWKGGVHTPLRLPRRRRGQSTQTSKEVVEAVRALARLCPDEVIAGMLNRNGLRTGRGNWWTRERVTSLRSWNQIPCYCAEQCASEGWMNLTEAAAFLGVSPRTLRLAVDRGEIPAEHPLDNGPWVFHRSALASEVAIELVKRAHRRRGNPVVPTSAQQELLFSST